MVYSLFCDQIIYIKGTNRKLCKGLEPLNIFMDSTKTWLMTLERCDKGV